MEAGLEDIFRIAAQDVPREECGAKRWGERGRDGEQGRVPREATMPGAPSGLWRSFERPTCRAHSLVDQAVAQFSPSQKRK